MSLPEYEHEWQAEVERLRAELAALREEMRVLDGNAGTLHDALQDLGRENERARELLARAPLGWQMATMEWADDVRAFLRGDEARRCACSPQHRTLMRRYPGKPHSEGCPARDECSSPENHIGCKHDHDEGPPCANEEDCDHTPCCFDEMYPARDEARRWCACGGTPGEPLSHLPRCPARDEARCDNCGNDWCKLRPCPIYLTNPMKAPGGD